ncbi:hypothetical protein [Paraburkholderia tropica]|uniref:hypothetical protein n=1 Tax=Paraburkholderia tropica TaxID=92647 RepID=UPI002AB791B2|nr:hypothetical protein [Paraburkholderia tropica]
MNSSNLASLPRPALPVPPTLKNAPPLSEFLVRKRKLKFQLAVICVAAILAASAIAMVPAARLTSNNPFAFALMVCAAAGLFLLYFAGRHVADRIGDFNPLPASELSDLRRNLLGEVSKDVQTDETRAELRRYRNEVRALERPFMTEDLKVLGAYNDALVHFSCEMRKYANALADFQQVYGVTMSEEVSE